MEIEKGFRYLVTNLELHKHCIMTGIIEVRILEISENCFKLKLMGSGNDFWVYNEWRFEIIERLEDYENMLYNDNDVLDLLKDFNNYLGIDYHDTDVKKWFDEHKKIVDE